MAKAKEITSADMRKAVRERYGNSSAVFDEVGDATGYRGRRRRADCIAMGLWPSRGMFLEGIEIKVSRSDWLAELKSPEKADAIAKYCDFWWLAVADETIVRDGELPVNWGLLVLDGNKLRCAKQAPKLEAEALDRSFVAALLRRAAEAQDRIRNEALFEGREAGRKEGPEIQQQDRTNAERDLEMLRKSVAEFEKTSGLKIDTWNGGYLGKVVSKLQQLRRFGNGDPTEHLESAACTLERFAKNLREERSTLRKELKLATEEPEMPEVANG